MPRHARRLTLPVTRGKNTSFDWLKSLDGQSWIRKQVNPAIGLTANGRMIAYILCNDAVFTVHYACAVKRERHFGMAGYNAGKYRGVNPDELGLTVKRFDIRQTKCGPRLVKKNFEIFVDL